MGGGNTYDILTSLQTFAQLSYGAYTNLSPSLHQSAQNCSHFSWSRQKPRRQHGRKRENMAIIIPEKLAKKSPTEMKLLSWHILPHLFTRKCRKIWGASAYGCWEAQDKDTKAAWTSPSQDPHGWRKDDLYFFCGILKRLNNLGL